MHDFRTGAIGALLDEFDRSADLYVGLIESLSDGEYVRLLDERTSAPLRTPQEITRHVIAAAYGHTDYLRGVLDLASARPGEIAPPPRQGVASELAVVCAYLAETFDGRWQMSDEEIMRHRFTTRWGVEYDIEQMLEHAIVHVLRHRRQIARLLGRFELYAG